MSGDAGGGPARDPLDREDGPARTPAGDGPKERWWTTGRGDGDAWAVVSYLLAGVGFWGLVGWLLDRWLHTSWLIMIGVLVGFVGAMYLIIRRYGRG